MYNKEAMRKLLEDAYRQGPKPILINSIREIAMNNFITSQLLSIEEEEEKVWELVARLVELKPYHMMPYNLGDMGEMGQIIDKLQKLIQPPSPTDEWQKLQEPIVDDGQVGKGLLSGAIEAISKEYNEDVESRDYDRGLLFCLNILKSINPALPVADGEGEKVVSVRKAVARLVELKPYHIMPYNLGEMAEIGQLIDKLQELILPNPLPSPTPAPQEGKNEKWRRYRFETKLVDDYRPLIFNPKYPWWCSGHGTANTDVETSVIIAYLPISEDLTKYWDDAFNIEYTEHNKIEFTERFPKPDYYKEL